MILSIVRSFGTYFHVYSALEYCWWLCRVFFCTCADGHNLDVIVDVGIIGMFCGKSQQRVRWLMFDSSVKHYFEAILREMESPSSKYTCGIRLAGIEIEGVTVESNHELCTFQVGTKEQDYLGSCKTSTASNFQISFSFIKAF